MRVLVISDLHGNWAALRAVVAQECVDQVFCLGDIVDYGPSPVESSCPYDCVNSETRGG